MTLPPLTAVLKRFVDTRRVWVPVLVSLFFLLWLFSPGGLHWDDALGALQRAAYGWLIPAVGLHVGGLWVRALRWQFLISPVRRLPLGPLFSAAMIGFFVNGILPMRVGELVRAHVLARRFNLPTPALLATIFAERLFDGLTLIALLGVAAITIPLNPMIESVFRASGVFFLACLVLTVGLTLAGQSSHFSRLESRFAERCPAPIRGLVVMATHFVAGLKGLRRPSVLIPVVLSSLAAWLIEAAVYGLVLIAFGLVQPTSVWLLLTASSNLATAVPSSQGGIGPFEFFGAQSLRLVGIDAGTAFAATVVAHATVLLPIVLIGAALAYRSGMSFAEISNVRRLDESAAPASLPSAA